MPARRHKSRLTVSTADERGREWVAIILAVGFTSAINVLTIAVLYDALINDSRAGLSENATQILTTGFGAMGGLLGAFLGAHAVIAGAKERPGQDGEDTDQAPAR